MKRVCCLIIFTYGSAIAAPPLVLSGGLTSSQINAQREGMEINARQSAAQNVVGSRGDEFSVLNPGSGQARSIFNSTVMSANNLVGTLPGLTSNVNLSTVYKAYVDKRGQKTLNPDTAPKPFDSKVAKSQVQGIVFVTKGSQSLGEASQLSTLRSGNRGGIGLTIIPYIIISVALIAAGVGAGVGAALLIGAAISFLMTGNVDRAKFISAKLSSPQWDQAQTEIVNVVINGMTNNGISFSEAKKIAPAVVAIAVVLQSEQTNLSATDKVGIFKGLQKSCTDCSLGAIKSAFSIAQHLVFKSPAMRLSKNQLEELISQVADSDFAIATPMVPAEDGAMNDSGNEIIEKTFGEKVIALDPRN